MPLRSPFDDGEIVVTRYYCPGSDITVEGRFALAAPFAQLSPEQVHFVETFVRCEGKLSRMEEEMNLSYPTLRNRLHDVIRALGYEPGKEESAPLPEDRRSAILAELDRGEISFEQAMSLLQGDAA
jgi:hypothetical protein